MPCYFHIFIKSFLIKISQRELELEKPGVHVASTSYFTIVITIICEEMNEFETLKRYAWWSSLCGLDYLLSQVGLTETQYNKILMCLHYHQFYTVACKLIDICGLDMLLRKTFTYNILSNCQIVLESFVIWCVWVYLMILIQRFFYIIWLWVYLMNVIPGTRRAH